MTRPRAGTTRHLAWTAGAFLTLLMACEPERPPQPDPPTRPARPGAGDAESGKADARSAGHLDPATQKFVLTFAGERGRFADTGVVDEVPEEARGLVRVSILDGPRPPGGSVWVTNLRTPTDGGRFELETVPRGQFEELALGQGRRSKVKLPGNLEVPDLVAAHGDVIVYRTEWCGVCKQVAAYLDRKGVPYVAKDIEKDPKAAGELKAKADAKGIPMGSVPMIDVRGELIVGFDRPRLEKLLD